MLLCQGSLLQCFAHVVSTACYIALWKNDDTSVWGVLTGQLSIPQGDRCIMPNPEWSQSLGAGVHGEWTGSGWVIRWFRSYFLRLTKNTGACMYTNVCPYTDVRGSCSHINEHFETGTDTKRYQSTGCTRQLSEQCVHARLTISIYSHICPGNLAWNIADRYCISFRWNG